MPYMIDFVPSHSVCTPPYLSKYRFSSRNPYSISIPASSNFDVNLSKSWAPLVP
jgi:hypothetical protein